MTAHAVWGKFIFFVALAVELLLLFIIFIILLIGVLGIFLPVIPGLLFVGLAAGIYSFILKSGYGTLSTKAYPHIDRFSHYMKKRSSMSIPFISKWWHATRVRRERRRIIQYGVLLFTINTLLTLVFILSMVVLSVLLLSFKASLAVSILAPLGVVFVFAGMCSVIWFRFGSTLGEAFRPSAPSQVTGVVVASLIPVLLLYGFLAAAYIVLAPSSQLAGFIMGTTMLITMFLSLFEIFIVHLGATLKR